MECFDVPLALHSLIGISLIIAGTNLMMHVGRVARGYGAYCFAFGYFILGLAAAGRDVGNIDVKSRRYLLGVGSAIAVVAGTFMMYYHVQDRVRQALKGQMAGNTVRKDIIKSIPIIDHVLIYAGFAGLVLTIALREDNSFNLVKGALAIGAFLVIGYTKNKMLEAIVNGQDVQKHQIAHILSWGLLVLAIAYSC
uniref:Uncharacterized protein n=1 Tax=Marseillevirus LCMAC202 TaxID=2506606 RepID=A0A481YYC0_9VIRU|nr:MAG: hypothetical protein LCMAC202_03510 [Marseillevirus LCMAC202]